MKKNTLFLWIFLIVTVLYSTMVTFADNGFENIQVYYEDIQIKYQGKSIPLKTKPFLYQDQVFVPIRSLLENLGFKVNWEHETWTVHFQPLHIDEIIEPCDPLSGEAFIYGQILSIDYENQTIKLEQHLDHQSREVFDTLSLHDAIVIVLKRNFNYFQVFFQDLKVGDIVGIILTDHNKIRAIIIDT